MKDLHCSPLADKSNLRFINSNAENISQNKIFALPVLYLPTGDKNLQENVEVEPSTDHVVHNDQGSQVEWLVGSHNFWAKETDLKFKLDMNQSIRKCFSTY